jgi:O-antigen ligase
MSRTPIISLLFFATLAYGRFWGRNRLIALICLIFSFGVVLYLFSEVPFFKKRFYEIQQTKWVPPLGVHHNSTNLRAGTYYCAASLLKQNWLFGLGTGNVQANLNNCYKSNGFSDVLYLNEYNTHNEYLNVWLNTGFVGFVLFLMSLTIPLLIAIKEGNKLYVAFLILLMLVFLTENILERQKGIIFYAFFNSLFAFNSVNSVSFCNTRVMDIKISS